MTDSQGQGTTPIGMPDESSGGPGGVAPRAAADGGGTTGAASARTAFEAPVTLADITARATAYVIDLLLVVVVSAIVFVALGLVVGPASKGDQVSYPAILLDAVAGLLVSLAYFFGLWMAMRATLGMKVLALRIRNDGDDAAIVPRQAAIRWAALVAPAPISQALIPVPGLGVVVAVVALAWYVALLITAATSPTRQGIHDRYAHTLVVRFVPTVS